MVASRRHAGVFWTHNEGHSQPREALYGITREGKSVAFYRIEGANLQDWEDIAIDDDGHLVLGDIGNNKRQPRDG